MTIDQDFSVVSTGLGQYALCGELDLLSVAHLDSIRNEVLAAGRGTVVFDLSELVFMDSSGLTALLIFVARGVAVTLVKPNKNVHRMLELTHLNDVFIVEHRSTPSA